MKKSSVYRTLQITSAVAVYSLTSVWASAKHVDIVTNTITSINSLLVILAIALAFPYFCFKVLAKLYTPPASRNLEDNSSDQDGTFNQEALNVIEKDDSKTMSYRGTRYIVESPQTKPENASQENQVKKDQPVFRYRGAIVDNSSSNNPSNQDSSSQSQSQSLENEVNPQKSAKPKERIKYRGSYVD